MISVALLLVLVAQDPAAKTIAPDSYANEATKTLVTAARAARDRNERLVTSYQAMVSQRIGLGLKAASRDRMLFRQELNAKIEWKRDAPSRVTVVGAREGIPVAKRGDQVPEDLDDNVRWLVINPAEDYLRIAGVGSDDEGFIYPLREGGEHDYRFALGDTTAIGLPSGKRVRIVELKIIPRRSDWRLMSGSLWFDADSYGLVRAVFRPARPFEFRRDVDAEDKKDVPAWVNPTGEVKFVTLEYGLYEDRWWMLRYLAIDAVGNLGAWLGIPFRMERVYSDYEVEGGTPPDPNSKFKPAGTSRIGDEFKDRPTLDSAARRQRSDSIGKAIEACVKAVEDSVEKVHRGQDRREIRIGTRRGIRRCTRADTRDSVLAVVIPNDTLSLLRDATLGPPILQMGDLITESELKGLADAIKGLPGPKLGTRVQVPHGLSSFLEKARYNRIEALSLSARGEVQTGRLRLDGEARLGVADLWPNLEAGITVGGTGTRARIAGYRRLATANPEIKPFGAVNSAFGLLAHRDDGQYFRATGVDLTIGHPTGGWWNLRFYAERQRAAVTETNWAISHVFGSKSLFRPNIVADTADQFGASLSVRGSKQFSQTLALSADLGVEAAGGDFGFGKGQLTLRGLITPKGPLSFAVAGSVGTSTGHVPVQSRFYLGGPPNLRGYSGGTVGGAAFWSGRIEAATSLPAARISVFSDMGWAGTRDAFSTGKPLLSAGVGGSLLDGLIRMDLSRGLRNPKGWRFDLYFDGIF